jgi:nitrite reductase (NO-forming)
MLKLQRRHVLTASVIAIAAALGGLGVFALFDGLDRTVTGRVHGGDCRVVRVALVDAAVGFDVTPDELVVDRGTHVVLDVVNEGDEVHDLAVEGGAGTRRLDPNEAQRLDLGVITSSLPELYSTLPGHKSAGMTLDIQIQDKVDTSYHAARAAWPSRRRGGVAIYRPPASVVFVGSGGALIGGGGATRG